MHHYASESQDSKSLIHRTSHSRLWSILSLSQRISKRVLASNGCCCVRLIQHPRKRRILAIVHSLCQRRPWEGNRKVLQVQGVAGEYSIRQTRHGFGNAFFEKKMPIRPWESAVASRTVLQQCFCMLRHRSGLVSNRGICEWSCDNTHG